jgi:hypothetical protein
MDIEALLNPEGKGQSQTMDESTDEEIYQVIMDAVDAHENIDNNGSDDVDCNNGPVEACPTIHKVWQAAVVLSRYIDELDDPIARKPETILGSFNHQLCLDQAKSMQDTVLTNFFSCL